MKLLIFQIPVFIFGDEAQNKPEKKVQLRINNPADIECYYEAYDGGTIIQMRSGRSFITDMTVDQVDQYIAGYTTRMAEMIQQERSKQGLLLQ